MELFDSGPRPPGGSFTARLYTAGAYEVMDQVSGARATLEVPVEVHRREDYPGIFVVRWSHRPASHGLLYDVQIRRPGDSSFSYWRRGVRTAWADFEPDAGQGDYEFRARLRDPGGDGRTGWSPVGVIEAAG